MGDATSDLVNEFLLDCGDGICKNLNNLTFDKKMSISDNFFALSTKFFDGSKVAVMNGLNKLLKTANDGPIDNTIDGYRDAIKFTIGEVLKTFEKKEERQAGEDSTDSTESNEKSTSTESADNSDSIEDNDNIEKVDVLLDDDNISDELQEVIDIINNAGSE